MTRLNRGSQGKGQENATLNVLQSNANSDGVTIELPGSTGSAEPNKDPWLESKFFCKTSFLNLEKNISHIHEEHNQLERGFAK